MTLCYFTGVVVQKIFVILMICLERKVRKNWDCVILNGQQMVCW